MSNKGPQFTSQTWTSFMEKLGITVSLTSSYHPQANKLEGFYVPYCVQNQHDWARYPAICLGQITLKIPFATLLLH